MSHQYVKTSVGLCYVKIHITINEKKSEHESIVKGHISALKLLSYFSDHEAHRIITVR